jgi:predicted DNA-binding ribbon-helix-helix protein
VKKRSFSIAGHRTSIALEPEFWTALADEARGGNIALAALIGRIDANRQDGNLASALRVHVLEHFQAKCARFAVENATS